MSSTMEPFPIAQHGKGCMYASRGQAEGTCRAHTSAFGGLNTFMNWSTLQWNQRMSSTRSARPCVTSTSDVPFA